MSESVHARACCSSPAAACLPPRRRAWVASVGRGMSGRRCYQSVSGGSPRSFQYPPPSCASCPSASSLFSVVVTVGRCAPIRPGDVGVRERDPDGHAAGAPVAPPVSEQPEQGEDPGLDTRQMADREDVGDAVSCGHGWTEARNGASSSARRVGARTDDDWRFDSDVMSGLTAGCSTSPCARRSTAIASPSSETSRDKHPSRTRNPAAGRVSLSGSHGPTSRCRTRASGLRRAGPLG